MRIARVFPRKTKATPVDRYAFTGPPDLFIPEVDEVHVSVTFTWDMPRAEQLAEAWSRVAPVQIGGPAMNMPGEAFVPGRYMREGNVITSRGCPNRCKHCFVPRREGPLRELPVTRGWKVQDDNLLACSRPHFLEVLAMVDREQHRGVFSGGLEAARLTWFHAEMFASLRRKPAVYFAYDEPDDYEPLRRAADLMHRVGFTTRSHLLQCYVFVGYPGDTPAAADVRCDQVLALGLTPMAMLWRHPRTGEAPLEWRRFQRLHARPALIHSHATKEAECQQPR